MPGKICQKLSKLARISDCANRRGMVEYKCTKEIYKNTKEVHKYKRKRIKVQKKKASTHIVPGLFVTLRVQGIL